MKLKKEEVMSTGTKLLIAAASIILLFFAGCFASVVGTNNELVAKEQGIRAQYEQNKNNYDNMWKKFKEVSQVPGMYSSDLKEVYNSAIKSRYGSSGSKAMFQWIKEHNPEFDSGMYKKIQVVVESGRNAFAADQKMLIDKKRLYETQIGQFPASIVAGFLGFPKIDLSKFSIVTSSSTEDTFGTGKSDELKLR